MTHRHHSCVENGALKSATHPTLFLFYQLDLITPGNSPRSASCRKQRRQSSNFRRKPRGRPQRLQRLCCRTLNFGDFLAFATCDVLAIISSTNPTSNVRSQLSHSLISERHAKKTKQRPG